MNKSETLSEQRISAYIRKRAISALVLAFIFFVCCYSANWWDYIGVWSFVFVAVIVSLLFWMLYLWIFEVALLIRDRRMLTKFHFIPIAIVSIYWILVVTGFFMIFEPFPLSEYDSTLGL
jgi:hydrogenase-4 membrane subunit HyfE